MGISISHCLGNNNCPLGDYSVKARMKNSCGYPEEWSDSHTINYKL